MQCEDAEPVRPRIAVGVHPQHSGVMEWVHCASTSTRVHTPEHRRTSRRGKANCGRVPQARIDSHSTVCENREMCGV